MYGVYGPPSAHPDNSGNAYATTNLPLQSSAVDRLGGAWSVSYSHSKLPDGLDVWTFCLSWVSASLLVDMTWRNVPLEICIGCLVISVILDDQTYVSLV